MKLYYEPNRLRIIGKVWEVRTKLKQMKEEEMTLSEWLRLTHEPPRVKSRKLTIVPKSSS